jgi:hypothetical protein
VQVGTYARPTGWQSKPAEFKGDDGKQTFQGYEIVKTGESPWQVANTDMTVTINNAHLQKATLLDTAGYPVRTIQGITSTGGRFSIKLPPNAMYVILE